MFQFIDRQTSFAIFMYDVQIETCSSLTHVLIYLSSLIIKNLLFSTNQNMLQRVKYKQYNCSSSMNLH